MNTTYRQYWMNRTKGVMLIEHNPVEEENILYPYVNVMTELVFDRDMKLAGNYDIIPDDRYSADIENDLDLIKQVKVIDIPNDVNTEQYYIDKDGIEHALPNMDIKRPQLGQYWRDKSMNVHLIAMTDHPEHPYAFQSGGLVHNYLFWDSYGRLYKDRPHTRDLVCEVQVIE